MPVNKRLRKKLAAPEHVWSAGLHRRLLDLDDEVTELKRRIRLARRWLSQWDRDADGYAVPRGALIRASMALDLRRRPGRKRQSIYES